MPDVPVVDVVEDVPAAGLVPRGSRYPDSEYPQVRWPWKTVRAALAARAASAPADQAIVMRYVNPRTGAPPLPTMGAEAQWLRPGERTRTERRTASAVFHVVEGCGESRIGDVTLAWERGDTFVAPPWHWVSHANAAVDPACLFQFTDEPALRALGLLQEETATTP